MLQNLLKTPVKNQASRSPSFEECVYALDSIQLVNGSSQGTRGIGFAPCQDTHDAYIAPPPYNSHDYSDTNYGKLHHDSLCLLRAPLSDTNEEETNNLTISNSTIQSIQQTENPLLAQSISQVLFKLRVFSFG